MIIDFAYPFATGAMLRGRGVNGIIRYLSSVDDEKCATADELAGYHAADIGTGLVFEDAAYRPQQGKDAGHRDGVFAYEKARALSVPKSVTIYAACDFDVSDYAPNSANAMDKLGPVGQYLAAFGKEMKSFYTMGAYGPYWLIKRAYDAGLCFRGWQTRAWSGVPDPLIDDRAALYQTGGQVFGGKADLNFAGWRDWGAWRRETRVIVGESA